MMHVGHQNLIPLLLIMKTKIIVINQNLNLFQAIQFKASLSFLQIIIHMKQDLNTNEIRLKFQMLINMDEQTRDRLQKQKQLTQQHNFSYNKLKQKPNQVAQKIQPSKNDIHSEQVQNRFKQVIFTKGDIVKQISKLKPYLHADKEELTTVEVQNMESKKMSSQEKKSLSNVIIYLNKRLCQKLRQQASLQQQLGENRVKIEQKGWIYEVFYRRSQSNKAELSNQQFKSGYSILTTVLELYENLTFTRNLLKLNVSEIKRVKYTSEKEYQIIDIRHDGGTLQIGFLNQEKLELFDRMLFLLKNMARTSTNRLFQNQLIKSLYAEY